MKSTTVVAVAGLLLFAGSALAQLRGGLLPIDQAYQVTAQVEHPGVVTIQFKIAPEYYLYRGRMKFLPGHGTELAAPKLPAGVKEDDPYFGNVQIYHGDVLVHVPYSVSPGATHVNLTVGYQGCHEVTPLVCYPPHEKHFSLALSNAVSMRGEHGASMVYAALQTALPPEVSPDMQRYAGSPAARAAVKTGDAAQQSGDVDKAISDYKRAMALDPYYAMARRSYTFAVIQKPFEPFMREMSTLKGKALVAANARANKGRNAATARLAEQYEVLVAEHPANPVFPWALGLAYAEADLAKMNKYCQDALKIDPKFAPAYECLSDWAETQGLTQQGAAYAAQAVKYAPHDKNYIDVYAFELAAAGETNSPEYKDIIKRYPDLDLISYLRVQQASEIQSQSARIAQLRKMIAAGKLDQPSVSVAADSLYGIYLRSNELGEAHKLAVKMADAAKQGNVWSGRVKFTRGLEDAQRQIQGGDGRAALVTLQSVSKLNNVREPSDSWYLLEARALDATGQGPAAFNGLVERFGAQPSSVVLAAIHQYGHKLGMMQADVHAAVWKAFSSKATLAHPFTFKRLDNGQPVSLSDYRGQVVIVDFWYPNCGPCRMAFPYLQQVAAKYKNKGVVVLAVNGIEAQQPAAEPFLKRHRYDFVGLAGNRNFALQAYGVIGFPGTFLIGPDGKIYMKPSFLMGESTVRSTELAINLLLARAKAHPRGA